MLEYYYDACLPVRFVILWTSIFPSIFVYNITRRQFISATYCVVPTPWRHFFLWIPISSFEYINNKMYYHTQIENSTKRAKIFLKLYHVYNRLYRCIYPVCCCISRIGTTSYDGLTTMTWTRWQASLHMHGSSSLSQVTCRCSLYCNVLNFSFVPPPPFTRHSSPSYL